MPSYTLYFLDQPGGHILERCTFSAKDDVAAVQYAESLGEHAPMELWRGVDKIKLWVVPTTSDVH